VNNDFLLAFILYLILHGIPRSEVQLEAESQNFSLRLQIWRWWLSFDEYHECESRLGFLFFVSLLLRAGRLSGFRAFALRGRNGGIACYVALQLVYMGGIATVHNLAGGILRKA